MLKEILERFHAEVKNVFGSEVNASENEVILIQKVRSNLGTEFFDSNIDNVLANTYLNGLKCRSLVEVYFSLINAEYPARPVCYKNVVKNQDTTKWVNKVNKIFENFERPSYEVKKRTISPYAAKIEKLFQTAAVAQ